MQTIKLKRIREGAHPPIRAYGNAVGADLSALILDERGRNSRWLVPAHNTRAIPTGWAVEPPYGHFLMVCSRSGLAKERTMFVTNAPGIIDPDYRGEIVVLLHNAGFQSQYVSNGDRIAQLLILPCVDYCFADVEELSQSERGERGFGSTGT